MGGCRVGRLDTYVGQPDGDAAACRGTSTT
jgi:hypothetical protein